MKTKTFHAMGSRIFIALDDDGHSQVIENAPEWFAEWENTLSRFIPDSEISRLNQHVDRWIPVSNVLWDALQCARDAFQMSDGLVDASMLEALQRIGYTKEFESLDPNGIQPMHMATASKQPGFSSILFNNYNQSVLVPAGCGIDLGGVAKGWAAHQAMLRLSQYAPALVNAGGDVAISGLRSSGEAWIIGITDPFNPESNIQVLSVKNGGIATSGKDYHRWKVNQTWVHHLLDPRTQMPAMTDILTSTIIAPSLMEAEMAAKTTFILGSRKGMKWLDQHPEFIGYFVLEDKSFITNEQIRMEI